MLEIAIVQQIPLFNKALHVSKLVVNKVQKNRTPSKRRKFRFFPPPPDEGKRLQVAVVYPGPAQEGSTSLAVHQIMRLVNAHPLSSCEPVFFSGEKPLGFVTGRPLLAFDLLAFSLSFEEQFVLLPHMLSLAGVPTRALDRRSGDPLVLAGGVACRLNPRPILPFLDALAGGDAEPVMWPLLDALGDTGSSRSQILSAASSIRALWVTGYGERAKAVWHDAGPPVAQIVTAKGAGFDDVLLVETGRGCPAGCRFCALGFSRRPPVFYSAEQVVEAAMPGIERGQRVGLVGASLGRHPQLTSMVQMLSEHGADLTPASLDPMVLGSQEGQSLLQVLEKGRQRSITLAPEAGSGRLRDVINKPFDDGVLLDAVHRLGLHGVLHLKLYLMYGLPTEQDDDLFEMLSLVGKVRSSLLAAHKGRGGTGRFSVSINPFVPKPHTPFRQESMPGLAELKRRRELLVAGFRKMGGVRVSGISPKRAQLQCLLDRVDESAAGLLEDCQGKWPPSSGLLRRTMKHWEEMVSGDWSPWGSSSFVDVGVKDGLLRRELRRSQALRTTPACSASTCDTCHGCIGLT